MNLELHDNFFLASNTKGSILLDFIDYANFLFNNGNKDIYLKPATFISVFTQGEGLLKPDLLSIHVNPFYDVFLNEKKELVDSWKGKKTSLAFKKALALEEPKVIISEIVTALKSLYSKPLLITIDSPQKWFHQIQELITSEKAESLSLDDLERASMYIAEFLRSFSTLGVNAIVLREEKKSDFSNDEVLSSYQPILNVANHYKWPLGIQFDHGILEPSDISDKVNFYLFQSIDLAENSRLQDKGLSVGGGLNNDFWSGSLKETFIRKGLLFGKIPPDAEPEIVLAQLKALQA